MRGTERPGSRRSDVRCARSCPPRRGRASLAQGADHVGHRRGEVRRVDTQLEGYGRRNSRPASTSDLESPIRSGRAGGSGNRRTPRGACRCRACGSRSLHRHAGSAGTRRCGARPPRRAGRRAARRTAARSSSVMRPRLYPPLVGHDHDEDTGVVQPADGRSRSSQQPHLLRRGDVLVLRRLDVDRPVAVEEGGATPR